MSVRSYRAALVSCVGSPECTLRRRLCNEPSAVPWSCASLLAAGVCVPARAADPPGSVTVAGDVQRTLVVDADVLRAFAPGAQVTFRAGREVDGQPQSASVAKGVRLFALLEQAGLAERDRFDWRKAVVLAIARDGYRAVFSWPELANTAAGAQVMVCYERDGAPLLGARRPAGDPRAWRHPHRAASREVAAAHRGARAARLAVAHRCRRCSSSMVLALKNAAASSNSTVATRCSAVQRSILRSPACR